MLTGPSSFGITYNVVYTGVKDGNVTGGPAPITGNGSNVVNQNPKVTVTVSNYTDSGQAISMHINVQVDAPKLGTITIFDDDLSGPYSNQQPFNAIVDHIAQLAKPS
ncbi:MAG: hypothetical protein ICV83_21535 [Cytophagales bacterium]|nr:hypothetical protein [Cytophagales bacterium]